MRKLFLAALGMTLFFIWLNRNDNGKSHPVSATKATPTPPRASSHSWPKQSLDRARAAADAARRNHDEAEEQ